MSYTDMDIEMKALSMLGSNVPDEDAVMLRTVCAAAAAELTLKADEVVSEDYACIPLYYKANNYLMKDYISGVYMVSSGNMYFKDAKVVK